MSGNSNHETDDDRRTFLKAAGVAAASVGIAGCGGGGDGGSDGGGDGDGGGSDGSDGSDGDDDGGMHTPTDTEAGADGGDGEDGGGSMEVPRVVVPDIGSDTAVNHMDPGWSVDFSQGITINLYDPLIMENPETHGPTAHLIKEWTTENKTTWVLTLREGVQFHSGNEMTADDVVYSWERILQQKAGFASFWLGSIDPEDGITARDDYTIEVKTNEPFGIMIATLLQVRVVDSAIVKEQETDDDPYAHEWLERNAAGSGPYMIEELVKADHIDYKWFPDYWQGWEWHDGRQFKKARTGATDEQNTVVLSFKDRDAAVVTTYNLNPETYDKIADQYDHAEVFTAPQLTLIYHPMNTRIPPTDDVNVRKAFAHAYDYETGINEIFGGGVRGAGPVPKNMFGYNEDLEPDWIIQQDLDVARQAIEDSDYTVEEINEIGVELHEVSTAGPLHRWALMFQSNLQEIGIEAEIVTTPWPKYTDAVSDPETTPMVGGHYNSVKNMSPDTHTYLMYHPDVQGTYLSMDWYTTDELTESLTAARATMGRKKRLEHYRKAQEHIAKGYPSIFVGNPTWKVGKHKSVEGVKYYGMLQWEQQFHDWRYNPDKL